ncbi:hypothetical protein L1785_07720 [Antribacter sp. KLBMP9083]|uniref:Uncharacterized protein n=1 Tax=Antribacter soli TaxID=2910976 RepID=A0AA41QCE5_9MICO|nr:hypothetical protein [Antribacter soli]MCF4120865.1 hypothetical protein [Antribacter soli]
MGMQANEETQAAQDERSAVEEAFTTLLAAAGAPPLAAVVYELRADVVRPGRLRLVVGPEGAHWKVAEARPARMVLRAGLDLDDPGF